ncbi:hypothetical protein [Sphingomonas sp. ERG5]|uniref:hypothetical protein n=1 Tax=Sphingomonas sp. ERG5 TaxID=1381597 RepID=UPI0009DFEA6D|nr:hypothetical protein [Sphingomonas sp. ERG5]
MKLLYAAGLALAMLGMSAGASAQYNGGNRGDQPRQSEQYRDHDRREARGDNRRYDRGDRRYDRHDRRYDRHDRRDRRYGWNNRYRPHCRTEWRHHRRVQICR